MHMLEEFIGEKISLVSLAPPKYQYEVLLAGSFRNNVLLVSQPSNTNMQSSVNVGNDFHVRINRDKITYTYHARVTRVCNEPYLTLQLLLENDASRAKVARKNRLKCFNKEIHISLEEGGHQIPVSMADISISGAKLVANTRLGKVGDILKVQLSVNGGANKLRMSCKIRYVRSEVARTPTVKDTQFHHGVEFLQLTENVENFLLRFVG